MLYLYSMTTKQKVFELLSQNKGQVLSGEKLAGECGVSRAAIWKAVKAIREDGFMIEATNNSGYCLCDAQTADVFSKERLSYELAQNFPEYAGSHIECFTTIDSTNTYAKKLLLESGKNFHHTIIAAESQSAGRGRIGRSFESPAGTGIYLSLIITPKGGITQPAAITASAAVAVCRAIKKLYGVQPAIKWINDIYIENKGHLKKCTGILTEGITNFESGQIESAVIGIGVNISPSDQIKKSEAASVAGYITEAAGAGAIGTVLPSRCRFIAEIAGQVFGILNESPDKVISEYKKLVFLIGQKITVHPLIGDDKSAYSATAIDIDENAALVVKLEDGSERTLNSGEVTLH
jgi:BirA family biotin operon repressor/biotin-[acetyl-CoA-carboxylase] ligase